MLVRLYRASTALQEIGDELDRLTRAKMELESLMRREAANAEFERKLQRVSSVNSVEYVSSSISGTFSVYLIPSSTHLLDKLKGIVAEIDSYITQLSKVRDLLGKIDHIGEAGFVMVMVGNEKPKVVIMP